MKYPTTTRWQQCNSETFWSEIALCDHVVQLYDHENELLHMLEDFVAGGISMNGTVIIIATIDHLQKLNKKLRDSEMQVDLLQQQEQLIFLDATELLSKFMVNGKPDKALFNLQINGIFDKIRETGRPIRAFGEMVALLWEAGLYEATKELEQFWNELATKETFSLYCAYPKAIFHEDPAEELSLICKTHGKLITNSEEANRFSISFVDIN